MSKRAFLHRDRIVSFDLSWDVGRGAMAVSFDDGVERRLDLLKNSNGEIILAENNRLSKIHVAALGDSTLVSIRGRVYRLRKNEENAGTAKGSAGSPEVRSPMPGTIVEVLVEVGQQVDMGDDLLILEAMKMENRLRAEICGVVEAIEVSSGDRVEDGDLLIRIAADAPK